MVTIYFSPLLLPPLFLHILKLLPYLLESRVIKLYNINICYSDRDKVLFILLSFGIHTRYFGWELLLIIFDKILYIFIMALSNILSCFNKCLFYWNLIIEKSHEKK